MTNIVFMWRHWVLLTPWWTFCKYLSFHMKATYLPVQLFPFNFSIPMCSLIKNTYPEVWKFRKNYDHSIKPWKKGFKFQNMSGQIHVSKWWFECDPHRSADLMQRSTLFICVETNSWYIPSSSIVSAVFWVNSAQFFSGRCISIKQHYSHFSERNPHHLPSNCTYALGGYLASKTLWR